ncbi:MAG: ABC transporter substrate-binding protein/permease [Proteobacteria bacterium]|nr:ABC transporter substrate-binding protein/permease [Pseudomonadota bacterium]
MIAIDLFIISLNSHILYAQQSKESKPVLRWAADSESGAPYAFLNPKDPDQIIGFEKDVITLLSIYTGQTTKFVQNAWDGLIPGLERNEYDIAINGIEITDERKKVVDFSIPYYATQLQLVVRTGETRFQTLQDLKGFKVGTLGGALTEKILRSEEGIEILTYESETAAHQDLLLGRSDAIFFDAPIAKYYSSVDSRFTIINENVASAVYGIAISKTNKQMLTSINHALKSAIESGELKEVYERWGLWNTATAQLFNDPSPSRLAPIHFETYLNSIQKSRSFIEKVSIYSKSWPLLLNAAKTTIIVSALSMLVAIAGGLCLVFLRLKGGLLASWFVTLFVEFIRGTPLLIQLFFIFYALPSFGIELSPLVAAVAGLGLNYAVQESEIYRSGLLSVHRNQVEAGVILGLSPLQIFSNIQMPQAMRVVLPPMTTDFIALIKDSSLVSVITMVEITKAYSMLAATYYDYVGFAIIAAVLYILIGMPLVIVSRHLEKRAAH